MKTLRLLAWPGSFSRAATPASGKSSPEKISTRLRYSFLRGMESARGTAALHPAHVEPSDSSLQVPLTYEVSWRIDATIRSNSASACSRGILVMSPTSPGIVSLSLSK